MVLFFQSLFDWDNAIRQQLDSEMNQLAPYSVHFGLPE